MRSTLPILLVGATVAQAWRAPAAPTISSDSAHSTPTSKISAPAQSNDDAYSRAVLTNQTLTLDLNQTSPVDGDNHNHNDNDDLDWPCDIGAWVRARDLSPDATIPAHARLAMNGSGCSDVKTWSVGLRYKERQITRLQRPGATFPVEPQWPSEDGIVYVPPSEMDIFNLVSPWDRSWSTRQNMVEEYKAAKSHPDLWDVHGAEHVLFDSQLELASLPDGESFSNDTVKSFTVHMPNTNFPPIFDHHDLNVENHNDEMYNYESVLQYYFNITLHNGSSFDYPAGEVGFEPTSAFTASLAETDADVETVTFDLRADEERSWDYRYPACEKANSSSTSFRLEVEIPRHRTFVQNTTTYLPAVLYKTSNGTEYPVNLTTAASVSTNMTWLHQFPRVVAANLTRKVENGWDSDLIRPGYHSADMRTVRRDQLELHNRRWRTISMGYMGSSISSEEIQLNRDASVQELMIPVQIPANIMPNSQTSFVQTVSQLRFEVLTQFSCHLKNNSSTEPSLSPEDKSLWSERRLCEDWIDDEEESIREQYRMVHRGNISISVNSPAPASSSSVEPTHFLVPGALGPVLALDTSTIGVEFPLVGTLRNETGDELRQERYRHERRPARRYRFVESGGHMSAAQLWVQYARAVEKAGRSVGQDRELV